MLRAKRSHRSRKLIMVILALLALVVVLVIFRRSPPPLTAQEDWSPGYLNLSMEYGGATRTFWVYIPAGYDGSTPMPLVVGLHGGTGSGEQFAETARMNEQADARGFIAVYPDGTGTLQTWNVGHCCGAALRQDVDDVGYIRALVTNLQQHLKLDPQRIYATGMSNGAMLAYRLAAEASDLFAAVAPVAGTVGGSAEVGAAEVINTPEGGPVSLIAIHGMQDDSVRYAGGVSAGTFGAGRVDLPVAESVGLWVVHDGCDSTLQTVTTHEGNIITDTYTCPAGIDVVLITIVDGTHSWPGSISPRRNGPQPNQDIDATTVVLDFLLAHTHP